MKLSWRALLPLYVTVGPKPRSKITDPIRLLPTAVSRSGAANPIIVGKSVAGSMDHRCACRANEHDEGKANKISRNDAKRRGIKRHNKERSQRTQRLRNESKQQISVALSFALSSCPL